MSDDGAGVDLARVKDKAIQNNLIDAGAEVSDEALMSVIFETGFSTAEKVSQIAGRGVGLVVVRNESKLHRHRPCSTPLRFVGG